MSKLILIPTPIGNLGDITLRAIETIKTCDFLYAEDTRTTLNLLKHLQIEKKLFSFHINNEHKVLQNAISHIQQATMVGLVSDAGTPAISDPGFLLVRACIQNNIDVETLPGPTAFVPALVNSGFPCDRFCFEGFLPVKKGRTTRLKELSEEKRTVILYESPHRLEKLLIQIYEMMGAEKEICVCREISKLYEETRRGHVSELLEHFKANPARGEIVVLLRGCS
ncbi:MAG: 16S rRNA (cytidine(1402)-2'-O)-methyltransferase [Bacteroidetes bacterium]|nr:16S rRNA (cytidine(1402)-2'-O)-methyltransferase [Bacteroidota bacterium]